MTSSSNGEKLHLSNRNPMLITYWLFQYGTGYLHLLAEIGLPLVLVSLVRLFYKTLGLLPS